MVPSTGSVAAEWSGVLEFNTVRVFRRMAAGLAGPSIIAAAIFLANPTTVARQDITELLSGADEGQASWTNYLVPSAAGSIHQAEASFRLDPTTTGSIASSGIDSPLGRVVATPRKPHAPETPDESRVNRAEKTGRIVSVTPQSPPKDFSAGSVLDRQSSLMRQPEEDGIRMAFAQPAIAGEEIKVASAFYKKVERKADPQVPAMLASLVTNRRADSLATAYAPVKPDFSRQSPFESLLKDPEEQETGRFIPPVSTKDHSWARTALPPVTFTAPEQKCLAEGIYFEARGETLKGQAAVGQVILNRVRNPAFPDTICGVVFQNDNWRNRCQFSFACDGRKETIHSPEHWKIAKEVAMAVTAGKIWLDEVGSSTHYHAVYVHPRWARTMQRKVRIGLHVFYRTFGGGWS